MSSWCSWLSRLSNTQTVSSSNLDEDIFLSCVGEWIWCSKFGHKLKLMVHFI